MLISSFVISGYAPPYPPPPRPGGFEAYSPPPGGYEAYPPPPPSQGGYGGYPPPGQPGYQGYFHQGYAPPPPPSEYQHHCHHHQDDGCSSFLRGWYVKL